MKNAFSPRTDAERKQVAERKEEARRAREKAQAMARQCLSSKDFQEYRKKYNEAREKTIFYLLELREPDPVKYAFEVQRLLNSLRSIGSLLNQVAREAGLEI